MASYTGTSRDATRIQQLERERKARQADLERAKQALGDKAKSASLLGPKFAAHADAVEEMLKKDTVGLVTFEDFKSKREHLEKCAAEERRKAVAEWREREAELQRARLKKANTAKLSFAGEEEEDDGDEISADERGNEPHKRKAAETDAESAVGEKRKGNDETERPSASPEREPLPRPKGPEGSPGGISEGEQAGKSASDKESIMVVKPKRQKLGKNPYVDTSFLPDRDRELAAQAERERLKQEWLNEQERIKNEIVSITYSYWDGAGHRRTVTCKKGTTVGKFLAMVQQEFRELRNVSPDEMMFIKEDLIIPHHYSFYDFIVTKARGKSGPLFNFDVHDDIRILNDAKKEKEDAHAGKVVERRWYERNKHIFPASRWEVYDPSKKYEKYTIHGGEVR